MAGGTRWGIHEIMGLTTMYDDVNERLVVERAERSVLAAAMVESDVAAILPTLVNAEDFATPAHALIYEAVNELVASRSPIDAATLGAALHQRGWLITVGGLGLIEEIVRDWTTSVCVEAHARIVRESARARRAGVAASKVVHLVAQGAPMAAIDAASVAVPATAASPEGRGMSTMGEAVNDVLDNIMAMIRDSTARTGITTGLRALDRQIGRLRKGQLIVVGGRPAMGKTALAQAIAAGAQAEEVALAASEGRPPRPVVFVSLEMQRAELVARDIARLSGVDLTRVISGRLVQSEITRAFEAATIVGRSPMKILAGAPKLSMIRAECHREKARAGGVALVVVDYIQLVPPEQRSDNREREVSETSRGLKLLAGELDCPVIALSQLNRSLEHRADKRPVMADLRESGAVEQDADVIAFVYRDVVYHPDSQDRAIAEIIIAKQRSGPTGTVRVGFDGARTAFTDLPGEDGDDEGGEGGEGGAPFSPRVSMVHERTPGPVPASDGAAIYEQAGDLPDDGAPVYRGESGRLALADEGPQWTDGDDGERGAA